MPVWHARTKALRASGKLKIIGITQEQHADRCLLFARWKGLDWPILWDPFNLTSTTVVPRITLIDEHGIVRSTRASFASFEDSFIDETYPAPTKPTAAATPEAATLLQASRAKEGSPERRYYEALSDLLWPAGRDGERAMLDLQAYAKTKPGDAAAQWRLGVAYRMRHDSRERSLGDFQQAVDAWRRGMELDPSHYIYRRRIEQYGPLLTKPYPFYPWVAAARKALGTKAPPLAAEPTGTELAGRTVLDPDAPDDKRPDTKKADQSVKDGLRFEATVVWLTGRKGRMAARVHLHVMPAGNRVLLWDASAPVILYVETPEGFDRDGSRYERRLVGRDPAEEVVPFDLEVHPENGKASSFEVSGYVLYRARSEPQGPSRLLMQRFDVTLAGPADDAAKDD